MNSRGFTLIESAAALLVAAVILSLGTASFLHLLPSSRLQGAVWEVTSKLNEARLTALFQGSSVRWRVLASADGRTGYVLEQRDPEDGSWKRLCVGYPPGVRLRANAAPVFTPRGTVSPLATILVENRRGTYRITLAITGRLKVTKG